MRTYRKRNETLLIRLPWCAVIRDNIAWRVVAANQIDPMHVVAKCGVRQHRRKAGRASDLFRGVPDHLVVMTGRPSCPVSCPRKGIGGPLLIIALFVDPALL